MPHKPISTTLKRLRGNPGKRPLNTREPTPPPFSDHSTPPELEGNAVAIAEWHRLAPMLSSIKQTTEGDRTSLIALCLEWSEYLSARRKAKAVNYVNKNGTRSAWLTVQRNALNACMRLWPELGLTPSSRSRITIAELPAGASDSFSEFDQPAPPAAVPGEDPTTH